MEDGTVRGWGSNEHWQIGTKGEPPWVAAPSPIAGLSRVRSVGGHGEFAKSVVTPTLKGVLGIAAGGAHSYFLMPEGQLLMAGFVKANVVNRTPAPFANLR